MRYQTFLLFTVAAFPGFSATIDGFAQTNLVSSVSGMAPTTDPSLINPWGMAFSATSPYWASDQGANVATLYNAAGVKQGLVVTVPGGPTGLVFNGTSSVFNGDNFIFSTLSGTIEGWRNALGTTPENLLTTSGAVYTGLAIGGVGVNSYLYAANFGQDRIDVLGSTGAPPLTGNFTDPSLPPGYAPYGIETIGSQVFVAYAFVDPNTHRAQPGAGQGFVDAYNLDGTFNHRAVTQGALDAPWGLAVAPSGFGSISGDLLVGNFGDGTINAFDAAGNLIGTVANVNG